MYQKNVSIELAYAATPPFQHKSINSFECRINAIFQGHLKETRMNLPTGGWRTQGQRRDHIEPISPGLIETKEVRVSGQYRREVEQKLQEVGKTKEKHQAMG